MRCPDARRALAAALDDELASANVAVVDQHVEACAACTRYRAGLHRLRASLRVEPVEHVVDLVPRVAAQLDAAPDSARRREPASHRTLELGLRNVEHRVMDAERIALGKPIRSTASFAASDSC